MSFSVKLQEIRREKGITQEKLAEMMNVSRQAVSKWESGEGYPETNALIQLANNLECSLDQLFADELDSVSDREMSEKKNIEQVFEETFSDVSVPEPEDIRGNNEFSWTKENIQLALNYLEKTGYHETIGPESRRSYYLVYKGTLYRQKVGRRFPKGRFITECENPNLTFILNRLKESGWFDKVNFRYDE